MIGNIATNEKDWQDAAAMDAASQPLRLLAPPISYFFYELRKPLSSSKKLRGGPTWANHQAARALLRKHGLELQEKIMG
jgi:hypothetical protein